MWEEGDGAGATATATAKSRCWRWKIGEGRRAGGVVDEAAADVVGDNEGVSSCDGDGEALNDGLF